MFNFKNPKEMKKLVLLVAVATTVSFASCCKKQACTQATEEEVATEEVVNADESADEEVVEEVAEEVAE